MAQATEDPQVAARATAEIEKGKWRLAFDMAQQGGDVLAHIMIAGARAKVLGALVVVLKGQGGNVGKVVVREVHGGMTWRDFSELSALSWPVASKQSTGQ